mgnify:CR=1 FL=1
MHYVPFTYVGTVDAYVLNSSSSGENGAADDASGTIDSSAQYGYTYDHSLFIADYNLTYAVSWDDLNDVSMIFGEDYTSSGVDYTLRVLSAGSDNNSESGENQRGTPENNEWDTILNKGDYIKNWSEYVFLGAGHIHDIWDVVSCKPWALFSPPLQLRFSGQSASFLRFPPRP